MWWGSTIGLGRIEKDWRAGRRLYRGPIGRVLLQFCRVQDSWRVPCLRRLPLVHCVRFSSSVTCENACLESFWHYCVLLCGKSLPRFGCHPGRTHRAEFWHWGSGRGRWGFHPGRRVWCALKLGAFFLRVCKVSRACLVFRSTFGSLPYGLCAVLVCKCSALLPEQFCRQVAYACEISVLISLFLCWDFQV